MRPISKLCSGMLITRPSKLRAWIGTKKEASHHSLKKRAGQITSGLPVPTGGVNNHKMFMSIDTLTVNNLKFSQFPHEGSTIPNTVLLYKVQSPPFHESSSAFTKSIYSAWKLDFKKCSGTAAREWPQKDSWKQACRISEHQAYRRSENPRKTLPGK